MKILCFGTAFLCAFCITYLFYKTGVIVSYNYGYFAKQAQEKLEKKHSIKRYLNNKSLWLRQMGVTYMMGRDISVYSFMAVRLFSAIVTGITLLSIMRGIKGILDYIAIVVVVCIGSCIPNVFLKLSNNMDNSEMLNDIRLIYDTLKIQSKSGVFITDILAECYLLVRTPRLKNALRELANEIFTKHDLQAAIRIFNSKFKNVYIDMLVMTIDQSVQSGQSVQMFQDIAMQIQEVEQAICQKEKRRAENKMLAYQLAVYFAILMIVVYAMFSQLLIAFSF